MIFSQELLYLHVPKTAGMALSHYLLEVLTPPLYYTHPPDDPRLDRDGVIELPGIRHESLAEAVQVVDHFGFRLQDFPLVLAVLRNPYSLEVSRFAYLQKGHDWDRGHNQTLALTGNFERFACESFSHAGRARPLESYFLLNGERPKNLRVVRFEELTSALSPVLSSIGIDMGGGLPYENTSDHGDFLSYYTPAAEAAVYERYRWAFDEGLYERLEVSQLRHHRAGYGRDSE